MDIARAQFGIDVSASRDYARPLRIDGNLKRLPEGGTGSSTWRAHAGRIGEGVLGLSEPNHGMEAAIARTGGLCVRRTPVNEPLVDLNKNRKTIRTNGVALVGTPPTEPSAQKGARLDNRGNSQDRVRSHQSLGACSQTESAWHALLISDRWRIPPRPAAPLSMLVLCRSVYIAIKR